MLPPEIYQEVLLNLPLSDLLRVAQVSRLFYQLSQWCLANPKYYGNWTLSLEEKNGEARLIPLDVEETTAHIGKLYVFQAKIRTITWCYEVLNRELLHISLASVPFSLRFLDSTEVGFGGIICIGFAHA
jgi:hypothetical protein